MLGNLLFSVILVLLMAVASKKLDRYILPATLTLDLIAVGGWLGAVAVFTGWNPDRDQAGPVRRRGAVLIGLAVACVVLLHGLQAFARYPYYALSFNPLTGGNRTAPHALLIGWGEGLNEVGDWLSAQRAEGQGDAPLSVVSWYEDGPLSYYLPGDSRLMSFIESDNYWFDADYVVLYANQWQRENPDPEMIGHFLNLEPVFEANAAGLELAKVYDIRSVAPPPFTRIYTDSPADFGQASAPACLSAANPQRRTRRIGGVDGLPQGNRPYGRELYRACPPGGPDGRSRLAGGALAVRVGHVRLADWADPAGHLRSDCARGCRTGTLCRRIRRDRS